MFDLNCFLICMLNFCHQNSCLPLFLFSLSYFFLFQIFNLLKNKSFFSFLDLSLLNSLHFSFFNLIDYDQSSLSLGIFSFDFTLFLILKTFKSFNLHHNVKSFVLGFVLFLQFLLFFKLLISNCDAF